MLTEDILLPEDGSWIAIVPLGNDSFIQNDYTQDCLIRFGALSTSYGSVFQSGDTIIVNETVYVRARNGIKPDTVGSLKVTR